MLSNAKISAVVPVTDLGRARDFYEGVLGLSVWREDQERGTVLYHGAGTYLLIYVRQTASSGEHTIVAFEIEGDADAVLDGLIEQGITFDTFEIPGVEMQWDDRGVLKDGAMVAAWFKDPDGNVINVGQGTLT
ncbi:MAG: glyoxalase [Anaerolineaceae bacterium]|nr:glyoxalase [Anaerolineaceae bacterium]